MCEQVGLFVNAAGREQLAAIITDRNGKRKQVWRAQMVLLTGDRHGAAEIMRRTGLGKPSVWRWRQCSISRRVSRACCGTRPGCRALPGWQADKVAMILDLTLNELPPADVTHWTIRTMTERCGVSHAVLHRIWRENGLAPHRFRQLELSGDPNIAVKVEEMVGLYVDPQSHAVIPSLDEGNGSTTLVAALTVLDGTVIGQHRQAAPKPGVHSAPRRHRAASSGRQTDPRVARLLGRAQAREGPGLTGSPSALDVPSDISLVLLAQRRHRFLRQAVVAASQACCAPLARRVAAGDQHLHRRPQPATRTVSLASRSKRLHHRRQSWTANIECEALGAELERHTRFEECRCRYSSNGRLLSIGNPAIMAWS
jgi:hypothetical protein